MTDDLGSAEAAAEPARERHSQPSMMQGFPPPPERRWVRDTWQSAPANRWTFRHLREVVPTARVGRADVPREFPAGFQLELGFRFTSGTDELSLAELFEQTETDGFLVLHRGRTVLEWYADGSHPARTHLLMSVSKSIIGCVVGILHHRGVLDLDAAVETYVPEVAESGYGGATIRDVLDMRSGVRFSEAYTDADAEVRCIEEVIGWAPRAHDGLPTSMYEYLASLSADRPHGTRFDYRSCETDLLGWVCERASGTRMPDLISDLIWSRIGTEQDMDAAVDPAGAVFHDGGLACTLRDAGRFGQMLLEDGLVDGAEVVPAAWITDSLWGADDSKLAFVESGDDAWLPGGHYRNQFWIPGEGQTLLCLGIHGQLIWIDRARELVVVKHSSWPDAQSLARLTATFAAVRAIGVEIEQRPTAPVPRRWFRSRRVRALVRR